MPKRLILVVFLIASSTAEAQRPRARDLGIEPGVFAPGPLNAITDVAGVSHGGYALGVLVQASFGGVLTIAGAPVGKELGQYAYSQSIEGADKEGDGSCMIVVATDAPLDARDLRRLAARAVFGLARTGSSYSQGSGDFAIAFTTSPEMRTRYGEKGTQARNVLPYEAVSPLFQAALEATEEAVYNALFKATTVTGMGETREAIPIEAVREILMKYRVVQ
jgi:D-aminopeptidase